MKEMEKKFNKIILLETAYFVFFAILGVIIFLKSEITNSITGLLIGTFLIIYGMVLIYKFLDKTKIRLFKPSIFIGIINVILGIIIMLNPLAMINILNIGLGIAILANGIDGLILYLSLKKVHEESNKLFLTSSILLLFMGILIIIDPFRSLVITKTVGAFIILESIVNINDLVLLKRRGNKILKLFK